VPHLTKSCWYTIEVSAIDLLTNDTVIRTADFTVKPAPTKPVPPASF
jgi:hypothetical protein